MEYNNYIVKMITLSDKNSTKIVEIDHSSTKSINHAILAHQQPLTLTVRQQPHQIIITSHNSQFTVIFRYSLAQFFPVPVRMTKICPKNSCCLVVTTLLVLLPTLVSLPTSHDTQPGEICHAHFVEYYPSSMEQKWLDHVGEWQESVCVHSKRNDTISWIKTTEAYNNHVGAKYFETAVQTVTQDQLPWGHVLSTFTYRRTCTPTPNLHRKEPTVSFVHIPIEPTASICRDPRKCWSQMTERYTQSKDYLVALTGEAFQKIYNVNGDMTSQAFLFDAGATIPAKNQENSLNWSGTDWIWSFYKNLGVTFDSVYAWEPAKGWKGKEKQARSSNSSVVTNTITTPSESGIVPPPRLLQQSSFLNNSSHEQTPSSGRKKRLKRGKKQRPRMTSPEDYNLTFFPKGVLHFRPVGISTELGHRENPLEEIKRLCKPEDFVVFKLDIDSRYEIEVVRTLLADPELLALVDEFYYEHHVRNHVMRKHGLGDISPSPNPLYTLQGWYNLVTPARRGGLRMHFWP